MCFVFLLYCLWVRVSSKDAHAFLTHVYVGLLLRTQVLGLRTQPSVWVRRLLPRNPSLVFYFYFILFSYLICSSLCFFLCICVSDASISHVLLLFTFDTLDYGFISYFLVWYHEHAFKCLCMMPKVLSCCKVSKGKSHSHEHACVLRCSVFNW